MGKNLISSTSPSSFKIVKLIPIIQKSRYYSDFLWDPVLVPRQGYGICSKVQAVLMPFDLNVRQLDKHQLLISCPASF